MKTKKQTKKQWKNYEVMFILPNFPGELSSWVCQAEDPIQAVYEANYSFFNNKKNDDCFIVRETNLRECKTAQRWATWGAKLEDAGNGFQRVVKIRRTA